MKEASYVNCSRYKFQFIDEKTEAQESELLAPSELVEGSGKGKQALQMWPSALLVRQLCSQKKPDYTHDIKIK